MMETDDRKNELFDKNHPRKKVKMEIYGKLMITKVVNSCGTMGRIYLPPEWIGEKVKIVKC